MLSVIIPVYNTEKYLRKCLDSIINQTYKDLEIICIDDCSTDNSFQILKEYELKDPRIKVFKNETNLKVGKTRNLGITLATGDYIHFMDSDDWLDLNAYKTLLNKIENKDVDIIYFLLRRKTINGQFTTKIYNWPNKKHLEKLISINDDYDIINNWQTINATKIYRKNFLTENNLYYGNYENTEDLHYCYTTLLKSNRIYITEDTLYNYRYHNPKSLVNTRFKNHLNSIKIFLDLYEFTKDYPWQIADIVNNTTFRYLFRTLWLNVIKHNMEYEEFKEIMTDLYEKLSKERSFYWHCYFEEVINKPKYYVLMKNSIRYFLFYRVPILRKFSIKLKKLLIPQ